MLSIAEVGTDCSMDCAGEEPGVEEVKGVTGKACRSRGRAGIGDEAGSMGMGVVTRGLVMMEGAWEGREGRVLTGSGWSCE